MTKTSNEKPRYRFCWQCNRQLYGNKHRVLYRGDEDIVLHAQCAKDMLASGEATERPC